METNAILSALVYTKLRNRPRSRRVLCKSISRLLSWMLHDDAAIPAPSNDSNCQRSTTGRHYRRNCLPLRCVDVADTAIMSKTLRTRRRAPERCLLGYSRCTQHMAGLRSSDLRQYLVFVTQKNTF
ncbi:hypothetical protein Y032_0481g2260 [Ancylostoma ceylanicum]|uniref:Uncharacterized protein n=1 Tax=Ancylostoma ceylanicum TaxID=53326 RepID=A0A016WVZ8_9BILA|nr:hypothetical protein Y032_0481g2260 [Ancylostoma ceylanicum]